MNQPLSPSIDGATTLALPPDPASGGIHELVRQQQAIVAIARRAVEHSDVPLLMREGALSVAVALEAEQYLVAELSADGMTIYHRLYLSGDGGSAAPLRMLGTRTAGTLSLAGSAMETGRPAVLDRLAPGERFPDPLLEREGIRSAIAVPLLCGRRTLGALAACSRRPLQIESQTILFAETIAHLVAATIARRDAERALEEERQLAAGVLQAVNSLVLILDPQGGVLRMNPVCEDITGFHLPEIRGRAIWHLFPAAEDKVLFQVIFEKLREGVSPVEYESCVLTSSGQRRRIAWSYTMVTGPKGKADSIIATGIDVTERRQSDRPADAPRGTADVVSAAQPTDAAGGRSSDKIASAPPLESVPLPAVNGERRKRDRRSFPYQQSIAPIFDGKRPSRSDFLSVECNDIGSGGFSYLSEEPPPSTRLLVALGHPPRITYLIAEVVHATRVAGDGPPRYRIGCSYTGRANY